MEVPKVYIETRKQETSMPRSMQQAGGVMACNNNNMHPHPTTSSGFYRPCAVTSFLRRNRF